MFQYYWHFSISRPLQYIVRVEYFKYMFSLFVNIKWRMVWYSDHQCADYIHRHRRSYLTNLIFLPAKQSRRRRFCFSIGKCNNALVCPPPHTFKELSWWRNIIVKSIYVWENIFLQAVDKSHIHFFNVIASPWQCQILEIAIASTELATLKEYS